LRTAASLTMPDLLTLDLTRIASHEPGRAQRLPQGLIVLDQRTRNAVANRTGLAGDAAPIDAHRDIELVHELHGLERLAHDHAARFATEELIERPVVDRDGALAGAQVDASGGGLAPTGAVIRSSCHESCGPVIRGRAAWAAEPRAGAWRPRKRGASCT